MLLIDDDASLRYVLGQCLRDVGHTVTEAAGGEAGVRAFEATPADLVVTDLDMPDLSGWDVARAVRALHPTVPVVLITGNPDAAEAAPELRARVQAILLKPFGVRALLAVVQAVTAGGGAGTTVEPGAPATAADGSRVDQESARQLSVLVVEDNPGDARLIQEYLREQPALRVVSADTLAAALGQLTDPSMDVVLLDLGLPDSQGVDTVTRVVKERPALPVIVVTGQADEAVARASATAGAAEYLIKGAMEPSRLIRAIQNVCARRRGSTP